METSREKVGQQVIDIPRLSRPSLSYQYPLPTESTRISPKASLAYPSNDFDSQFILSPNVRAVSVLEILALHILTPNGSGHTASGLRIRLRRRDLCVFIMRKR